LTGWEGYNSGALNEGSTGGEVASDGDWEIEPENRMPSLQKGKGESSGRTVAQTPQTELWGAENSESVNAAKGEIRWLPEEVELQKSLPGESIRRANIEERESTRGR